MTDFSEFCKLDSDSLNDRHLQVAPCGSDNNPSSNTGLILQDGMVLGVDWLTYVLPIAGFEDVEKYVDKLENIFTDSFHFFSGFGRKIGRQFANSAKSACGSSAVWNLPGEYGDTGSIRITLPGKVLVRAKQMHIISLISYIISNRGKINRIDLKVDDFTRAMLPEFLEIAFKEGNFTGFRDSEKQYNLSGDIYKHGWTLKFGSRKSDRFTRYYNALPVHGLECWRFEVEFKNDIANEVASQLTYCLNDESMLSTMMGALIAGNISFIDKSNEDRVERCAMMPWWKTFTDRLGSSMRLSVPKIIPTIQRSIDWLRHKVAPSLAMVRKFYGNEKDRFMDDLFRIGDNKLTKRHQTILESSPIAMRLSL